MSKETLNKTEHSIDSKHGKRINFDVTRPEGESVGVVVFCHGFKGFKDWGHFNLVAEAFVNAGMTFVKLNFSHNGTTAENPIDFVDLEAFGNNNFSKELDDLGSILDWVEVNLLSSNMSLFLMGHSRGGGIVVLKAAEDNRIQKMVTWSAVSDFESRFPNDMERYKREGVVYIPNARTHQNMPLYYQFVEDYYAHEDRLNISNALGKIAIPSLIIHGSEDEAVSLDSAELIHNNIKGSFIKIIDGAGHTFGAVHPFEGEQLPIAAQKVVDMSVDFFLGDVNFVEEK